MIEQLKTIRHHLEPLKNNSGVRKALTALAQIEAAVGEQEPVLVVQHGEICYKSRDDDQSYGMWCPVTPDSDHGLVNGTKLYTAAPVAQQHETVTNDEQARAYMDARLWEFIDMAGMWPKAKPDPRIWAHVMVYAPPAQQPQKLEDVEQYRMQMAGISTAAIGYWKEGDSIHPDYDTPALRDVAKLYSKYDALYKAQQPQAEAAQNWRTLLLNSEDNFVRQFGVNVSAAWVYRDLEELFTDAAQQPQAEKELRKILCVTYAGAHAYMDDGEAQDSRANPTIDFMRDTPAEIQQKMRQRSLAQQPQADLIPEDALFVCGQMGANVTRVYAAAPQQAEAAQYTRADLDRAYSAGLVEGERLAIQQAEAVPPSNLIDPDAVVSFAVDRWLAEVANRPLVNVNRRTLDDTWRQVIRRFGGDPVELLGPPHDELAAIAQQKGQP